MAGKIPGTFIDELMARVDIVDVIDRRVPLTRKGKEFMACCPFHEEKTPSFTVSPSKQFYHCFGCGAHGTAIGFLMEYANLGFVESVEELADGVGLEVPTEASNRPPPAPGEGADDLLHMVSRANTWFQEQLRNHPDASQAVAYLKGRGLDGRVAADFGIGFAPDNWSGLIDALGTSAQAQKQLMKAGLVKNKDDQGESKDPRYYDRMRGRIIFPIEDHRGRVVGFGGRIVGSGEPKYLNSPETPLFHKGAELYGLHRARRAIAADNKSIVVEGYMDVVSLSQFGVENSVAALGTATTRVHLQRLFRLAPEIVFCFDGDNAGRSAAWKAMQVSLPEMQDGRQIGFLFLEEGEDPDTTIRSEGRDGFMERVAGATSLPDFLFDSLVAQVDMNRIDGKARLVSMVKPLLLQLPRGALQDMMFARLSSLSGLTDSQLGKGQQPQPSAPSRRRRQTGNIQEGQISPMALAISLVLQNPQLAETVAEPEELHALKTQGADILARLVDLSAGEPDQNTARLLEAFRDSRYHGYLEKLAVRPTYIDDESREAHFADTIDHLMEDQKEQRRLQLLEKSRQQSLESGEKQELAALLQARVENPG
jgi:DNA primase